ncbi:NADP-dependent 3-hydroxy acid dehydrogenase YdfG [Amycolatopsis arida]|uniref:NADP-dependent 3-hydroxy acid dehydrogenase YdfG n=1 Tax=Amycolatopsis arida TaxID=587909 RepID=A0A1I5VPV7_9PSEU|nr:NADP-dependent 3-hydroxy acid dehydrogenase YdfG [Amycolatopsis arida]SFQ09036.1 NADP-dependent 3-hydroxy acid dehydrogenase YdfG [Amycolatopsis arida]
MPERVAVVTGAGSGIGRAVATTLLTRRYRVVLAGRREGALRETAAGASEEHSLILPTDVTDAAAVAALFERVRQRWGRVDLLVNNAGTFGPRGAVDEIDPDQWRAVVEVNLTGMFLCAHHAVRLMKTQDPSGGRIINNGSISAHAPRPRSVAYTATKHAITGLTKSIALDGRAFGIACGQIDIGNAATELTAGIAGGAVQADGSVRPEPTFDVEHAARAVLYMADLPPEANVPFLTLTATGMPYLGRG